jgi:metallo-beta-lactamase family protein
MKISFYGAAREVTGSKHLLEVNGKKILLDCGMFQGNRKESKRKNEELLFNPAELDMIVLSHAHMDHTGLLPYMTKNGFQGEIICTYATKNLCEFMLRDSAYIQEREVEFIKRHKNEALGEPVEPLYREEDAVDALKLFHSIAYHERTELYPGVWLTYFDAGHILGSAIIYLEIDDQEDGGKRKTLTFSGDIGRKGLPILRDPEYIAETDFLIMETTYGNRFHKFIDDVDVKFEELIKETIAKGGKIIIPAFALERTQEVVYHLNVLCQQGRIPVIPVYVDSPLAVNVTGVFKKHTECFDEATNKEFILNEKNPFGFGMLKYITDVADSKALNDKKGPMIIISASGMMEHGRVLHHLRNNIEDERNLIMVVGYQAEHTLGRKILNKDPIVKIFGKEHRVRAKVAVLDAFSGHADRSDLLDFVEHVAGLDKLFLVHGEEKQGLDFCNILKEIGFEDTDMTAPRLGESFQL